VLLALSAAIHRIVSGRTTKRDMIGELADACHMPDPRFILYYNHSRNGGDAPLGALSLLSGSGQIPLVENLLAIPGEFGARYDCRLDSWWFDSRSFGVTDAAFTTRHHGNARLRLDACIKFKCLVSAVDADFNGDETKLCVSQGEIIGS
jgi:hypothetical protein